MSPKEKIEQELKETIKCLGIPLVGSYRAREVCAILGISRATFMRFIVAYHGLEPVSNATVVYLASYKFHKERRVKFTELVDFLVRNDNYEKECS